jgi:hypothetical protein
VDHLDQFLGLSKLHVDAMGRPLQLADGGLLPLGEQSLTRRDEPEGSNTEQQQGNGQQQKEDQSLLKGFGPNHL